LVGVEPLLEALAESALVEGEPEDALVADVDVARRLVVLAPPAHDPAALAGRQDLVAERDVRLRLGGLGPRLADQRPPAQLAPEGTPLVEGVLGEQARGRVGVALHPRAAVVVEPLGQAGPHEANLCHRALRVTISALLDTVA